MRNFWKCNQERNNLIPMKNVVIPARILLSVNIIHSLESRKYALGGMKEAMSVMSKEIFLVPKIAHKLLKAINLEGTIAKKLSKRVK